jgi:8-oxo-dGTP pyrophosphatase MutT (NUDIX family)
MNDKTRVPEDADRDFVAGAFIVEDGRVLLLNHKKYGFWLQPGGHVEPGETPDEAAVRETMEETGLEVEVVGQDEEVGENAVDLPMPFNVNLHKIEDGHWHCDFQYLARVQEETDEYEYDDSDMKWFSKEDLKNEGLEIPENARRTALDALKEFN